MRLFVSRLLDWLAMHLYTDAMGFDYPGHYRNKKKYE